MPPTRSRTKRVVALAAAAAAALVAVAVAGRAVYLLVVGEQWVYGPPRVEYRPYPPALFPLASAALVLVGLAVRRQRALAWAGVLFLALFGGLYVFGQGGIFLYAVLALLPLLLVVHLLERGGG